MNDERRQQYLESVNNRLAWLHNRTDGILLDTKTVFHRAVVLKKGRQVQLFFVNPDARYVNFRMIGAMSRIDLDDPLNLLAVYTQASMLALAWKPSPERICLLGLGGGRLALAFHYMFPGALIDCVEIDPSVVDISETYFGFAADENITIVVQDAREFIETLPESSRYDIILVDCFTGSGHHPVPVATYEFYQACKRHLSDNGVVVTNILESDPVFTRKTSTFAASFNYPCRFAHKDADVFFGCDGNAFEEKNLLTRARELENSFVLLSPFSRHAKNIHAMEKRNESEAGDIIHDTMLTSLL